MKKVERVRIADLAEELGVSVATVSNVIHGKTKKISAETVKRVQELLEKRAYLPGMASILLGQNDSRIIGVVVNDHEKYEGRALEDGFISAAINALSAEIDRAGRFMMVKVTAKWEEIPRFASMWNMDGLVLMGFCAQDYKKLRESMHIPFVTYDGYFQETRGICNLTIDNYDGGFQAGEYLKRMGHGRVLCIADNFTCMDLERAEGCAKAMGSRFVDRMQVPFKRAERMEFYRNRLPELLSYTAIFALSDFYAAELICWLQKRGVKTPEEISVMGFDDSSLCQFSSPALTTVRQDMDQRAKRAVSMLQRLKSGQETPAVLKLPVALVERESVKDLTRRGEREERV